DPERRFSVNFADGALGLQGHWRFGDWRLGDWVGDWRLGDWRLGRSPLTQSPITKSSKQSPNRQSPICLFKRSQRVLELSVVRFVARVVQGLAIPDRAPFIYDDHSPLGDVFQAHHVRIDHVEGLDGFLVVVAEQRKSELLLIGP